MRWGDTEDLVQALASSWPLDSPEDKSRGGGLSRIPGVLFGDGDRHEDVCMLPHNCVFNGL